MGSQKYLYLLPDLSASETNICAVNNNKKLHIHKNKSRFEFPVKSMPASINVKILLKSMVCQSQSGQHSYVKRW